MTDYAKQETNALAEISQTVDKLDKCLDELDKLNSDSDQKHAIKKWFAEKQATHDIKRILNKIDKYDKYNEKELEQPKKHLKDLGLDDDTIVYIENFFG